MPELLTYLGKQELKTAFLAEIAKHEAADAIVKGTYGEKMNGTFKGCAVGCSLYSLAVLHGRSPTEAAEATDDHTRYERELGLPTWLAYLEDHLFERLPAELAKTWPRRFAEAIPVGAMVDDLVLAKILRWTLADATYGARYATDDADIRGHIDGVIAGFDHEIAGTATTETRAAMERAAWAAWAARAARAVWAVWDARAVWAARAVWDAAIRDGFYPALSEYALTLLRELPEKTDA